MKWHWKWQIKELNFIEVKYRKKERRKERRREREREDRLHPEEGSVAGYAGIANFLRRSWRVLRAVVRFREKGEKEMILNNKKGRKNSHKDHFFSFRGIFALLGLSDSRYVFRFMCISVTISSFVCLSVYLPVGL